MSAASACSAFFLAHGPLGQAPTCKWNHSHPTCEDSGLPDILEGSLGTFAPSPTPNAVVMLKASAPTLSWPEPHRGGYFFLLLLQATSEPGGKGEARALYSSSQNRRDQRLGTASKWKQHQNNKDPVWKESREKALVAEHRKNFQSMFWKISSFRHAKPVHCDCKSQSRSERLVTDFLSLIPQAMRMAKARSPTVKPYL